MHYKDENITRNIFMNLILAKELPVKLLIIKEACHALHIITLKKGSDRNLFPNDERVATLCH